MGIGGGDQRHAAPEQRPQKLRQNHGIADIRDDKLVKAEYPDIPRQTIGNPIKRIGLVSETGQTFVYLLHQPMKVNPAFLFQRERIVKEIDQPGFSTADAAPDVESSGNLCIHFYATGQALYQSGFRLGLEQLQMKCMQPSDDLCLGWIRFQFTGIEKGLIFSLRGHPEIAW